MGGGLGRIFTVNTKTIYERLKDTSEQQTVVGPLVSYLVDSGWHLEQIVYGRKEWSIPKSPSEATRREKGQSYSGVPVDIAVFDDPGHVGDPRHLLFIIECKQPTEEAGIAQLESYYVGEPHCILGIWANDPTPSAKAVFLYSGRYTITTSTPTRSLHQLTGWAVEQGIELQELSVSRPSLEDLFIELANPQAKDGEEA